jgi:Ca2+-binding RTX toxin-like protein
MDSSTVVNTWGDPNADAPYWREQKGAVSCAVVAQASVYQSITGEFISEQNACKIAIAKGWFSRREGTSVENVGNLLNYLDITTYKAYNATLDDIKTALANGEKLIVGLDPYEIWYPIQDESGNSIEQFDLIGHAVWVTGVEQAADGSYQIILNDSGTPNGQHFSVSYEDFENAWGDYGHYLLVADHPITSGWLTGSYDDDVMNGNSASNWMDGSSGSDTLLGNMGNDTLVGGTGKDLVAGGGSSDLLIGGTVISSTPQGVQVLDTGIDVLFGDGGRDTFALATGQSFDSIADFQDRRDCLGLTNGITFDQLTFQQRGDNTIVRFGGDKLAVLLDVRVNQISSADFTTVAI